MEIRVQEQAVQLEYTREQSARELPSAEQNQLKSFHAARRHLVEKRSSMIKAMSFAGQNEQTEAHVDLEQVPQKASRRDSPAGRMLIPSS
jgi:hypothetical protein